MADDDKVEWRLRTLEIEVARMKDRMDTLWKLASILITPLLLAMGTGLVYLIVLVSNMNAGRP